MKLLVIALLISINTIYIILIEINRALPCYQVASSDFKAGVSVGAGQVVN